jgi:Tfp pilus assembly protein PilF
VSIILDALRRGRAHKTPRQGSNAARTDAVLHTLGYSRFHRAAALRRFNRGFIFLILAALAVLTLWGGVIWLTRADPDPVAQEMSSPAARTTQAPFKRPESATPPAATANPPPVAPPGTATPSKAQSASPAARPLSNAPTRPDSGTVSLPTPAPPAASRAIVEHSPRAAVPDRFPPAPVAAPSSTAMSTLAGTTTVNGVSRDEYFRRAVVAQRLGDFENALFNYKQVLQRDDLNIEAHNNLGLLYRDKGLLEEAVREFLRALAISPGYARARNNLGVVYLNQRKLDDAAAQFHSALAIDPKNVESFVNLSIAEKQSGRRDAARTALVRALEIDPRNAEAYYNFGVLEDESGMKERALAHYRAFLQHGAATHPALVGQVRKRVEELESRN